MNAVSAFFRRSGEMLMRGVRLFGAWLLWPIMAAHGWYRQRNLLIKLPLGAFLILFVGLYGYFVWQTQVWSGFDPNFVDRYKFQERTLGAGQEVARVAAPASSQPANASTVPVAPAARQCQPSGIVEVAADLTDINVNQNAWISSMLMYRLGFFGLDWDRTPFLDNKAAFQRGVNQTIRRTAVELVDSLGRVRGTSGINGNLQDARGNLQFDEYSWYFGLQPFGFKTPTPSYYRAAIDSLRKFNLDLISCNAVFDGRADNLVQFVDRIANDLGSTSAILRERSENYNGGWFDTRADDRFWFAYGQLYGYYAIMTAAGADFNQVIRERNLGSIWNDTLEQFRGALKIRPLIISNGAEDGLIMPSHLATIGFYTLRTRSNLVEIRSILDR